MLRYATKKGRNHKQTSERFPAEQLVERSFYFSIPRRMTACSEPLSLEVKNYKGLNELSLGFISFPAENLENYKAQLFHCGKPIGEMELEVAIGKRLHPK